MSERLVTRVGGRRMAVGLASSAFLIGSLGACSDNEPSNNRPDGQPSPPPPFRCDGAPQYIPLGETDVRDSYVKVPVVNAKDQPVRVDEVILDDLGSDFINKSKPKTRYNHVTIKFPDEVVQIAVTAIKKGNTINCETLLYPNE